MIRTILFDVDGVLVNSFEANFKFYYDFFRSFGYEGFTRDWYIENQHLTFMDVIRKIARVDDAKAQRIWDAGYNKKVLYTVDLITLMPGVRETIPTVANRYSLGIVTNKTKTGKMFEIKGMDELKGYFKTIVYSEDVQKPKPDPAGIRLALQRLDSSPEEAVYVGDMPSDMKAAKDAGVRFIAFRNERMENAKIWTPDFSNIPHLIEMFNS